MANARELILRELQELFPNRTFDLVMRLDDHAHLPSYQPQLVLVVDGKASTLGYIPTLAESIGAEQFAASFVHNYKDKVKFL